MPWRDGSRYCGIRAVVVCAALLAVFAFVPLSGAAGTVLLGDQNVEATGDTNSAGRAEAFRTSAVASGQLASLTVYVAAGSAATTLVAGVYGDSGGHPGALLAQGSLAAPKAGAWNTVALGATPSITSGTTYWLAILSPKGTGTLAFRDVSGGAPSETSASATLSTLPSSWSTGKAYRDSPVSAYGVGTLAPDTTPPTAPTNVQVGTVTQTSVAVSWTASTDNVAVTGYDTYVNSTKVGTTTGTGFTFTSLTCGTTSTFGVVAFDAAGNRSGMATVSGATAVCDTTPPVATITSAPPSLTNQTTATFAFTSSKPGSTFQCALDGAAASGCTSPISYSGLAAGGHTFTVTATDSLGNVGAPTSSSWTIDTTPPTVALTSPASGASVSGSVTISADAGDDVGPVSVQFQLDGNNLGAPVTAAPYTLAWDTTGTANGTHTLSAVARDGAGNTTTSTTVSVTVANSFDTSNAFKEVAIGEGYVDSTERQIVRTSGNVVYAFACDDKVTPGVVRAWKGAPAGIPTSFAEVDAAHHPTAGGTDAIEALDARLDRNGIVHVVYLDNYYLTTLYYQTFSTLTDTWGPREVIATNVGSVARNHEHFSLILDNDDKPHVVYMAGTSIDYTNRVSGSWSAPQTIGTDSSPLRPSMAFDSSGSLYLVWLADGTTPAIKYKVRGADGTWGATEVVAATNVLSGSDGDQGPSVVVTQAGIPYVLWVGVDPGVATPTGLPFSPVRVSYRSGGVWLADNPPTEIYTHSPQIYSRGNDIYVFLGHDINLHYGYLYQLSGQAWSNYIQLSNSITDGSASVRWDPQRETNASVIDTLYYNEDKNGDKTFIPQLLYMAVVPGGDTTPPTVALTAPAGGATVSGSTTVSATASDNLGVAGVQFQVDGANIGSEVTAPPYTISWDTTTVTNGTHTLTAVARDATGNTASSSEQVTVSNTTPPPPPPPSGIAFVKQLGTNSQANTGGSVTLTVPSGGVAQGDTVIVWAAISGSGTTVSSITDSKGNSYTVDATINNSSFSFNTFVGSGYAATALSAGSTITVTFSGSYYSLRLAAGAEFSGIPATGRLDQKATATGSGTTPASGSTAATSTANELVVGGFGSSSLATFAPASGFTALTSVGATLSSVNLSIYQEYELVQTTGSYQASGTLSASSPWDAAVATYK